MFLHPNFLYRTGNFLVESTIKRRDLWDSREEAHRLFRERSLKAWDPRVIDLYVVRIHSVRCPSGSYCSAEIWLTRTANLGLP